MLFPIVALSLLGVLGAAHPCLIPTIAHPPLPKAFTLSALPYQYKAAPGQP